MWLSDVEGLDVASEDLDRHSTKIFEWQVFLVSEEDNTLGVAQWPVVGRIALFVQLHGPRWLSKAVIPPHFLKTLGTNLPLPVARTAGP